MDWKSVCCAVQGRGHVKKNIPCQDKVARRTGNGVSVIVLADGAGSAALSHFGAECVVNSAADFVVAKFFEIIAQEDGREVMRELLSEVLAALKKEAEARNCALKDLASTLLVAAVSDENFFLAHLGDGVVGYLSDKGLKAVSTPDNGEFANETVFVTSEDAGTRLKIYKGALKKISGFVLMSDGTEQSLYNKRQKTLAPALVRLLHRTCLVDAEKLAPQLEEALREVVLENTQDDCSLALLARTSEELPPLSELPISERQKLYKIEGEPVWRKTFRRIFWCDRICAMLKKPLTLAQISRGLHLKGRYAQKKLQRLVDAGIITRQNFGFETYCR